MSQDVNVFGLHRDIPDPIKRKVRQRDGFGCVVCGFALCDYEHFDPEFKNARDHKPEGIILLCQRCHGSKGAFLSRATIARAARNPIAKQRGWSHGMFDVGNQMPTIEIGCTSFSSCETILEIFGEKILSIKIPEELWGPFRINANLRDRDGNLVLKIVDNVFETSISAWDADATRGNNGRITIRSAARQVDIVLRPDPPNRLVFERLNLSHLGVRVWIDSDGTFNVVAPHGAKFRASGEVKIGSCDVAFRITESSMAMGCGNGGPEWAQRIDTSKVTQIPFLGSYFGPRLHDKED